MGRGISKYHEKIYLLNEEFKLFNFRYHTTADCNFRAILYPVEYMQKNQIDLYIVAELKTARYLLEILKRGVNRERIIDIIKHYSKRTI